jgi:chemotaxis protein methyltransferase CheR
MKDGDCVEFLQWALPRLHLEWSGYRKVRRQVCRRVDRRLQELSLPGISEYRTYLESHPPEWSVLDTFCWISISRFYRDQAVFRYLGQEVMPQLAQRALHRGADTFRIWCIGCASGEEPYTLAILWMLDLQPRFPALAPEILGTDADAQAIERACLGRYPARSVKDLPSAWRAQAFVPSGGDLSLEAEYRKSVRFLVQDIRTAQPGGLFDLILCRNVAFTYFDEALQRVTLRRIAERLVPEGALLVGTSERLPDATLEVEPWNERLGLYRKAGGSADEVTGPSRSSRSHA